jgi:predicted esterase
MVVHGTNDPTVPYSAAVALQNWATSAGLPLDFQAVAGAGHVPSLYNYNAIQGVTLFQRSVDFHHETVFTGLDQGPQPPVPPGC